MLSNALRTRSESSLGPMYPKSYAASVERSISPMLVGDVR